MHVVLVAGELLREVVETSHGIRRVSEDHACVLVDVRGNVVHLHRRRKVVVGENHVLRVVVLRAARHDLRQRKRTRQDVPVVVQPLIDDVAPANDALRKDGGDVRRVRHDPCAVRKLHMSADRNIVDALRVIDHHALHVVGKVRSGRLAGNVLAADLHRPEPVEVLRVVALELRVVAVVGVFAVQRRDPVLRHGEIRRPAPGVNAVGVPGNRRALPADHQAVFDCLRHICHAAPLFYSPRLSSLFIVAVPTTPLQGASSGHSWS